MEEIINKPHIATDFLFVSRRILLVRVKKFCDTNLTYIIQSEYGVINN